MPFKKFMLLKYETAIKFGIWGDRITSQPWELTIRVVDWWGLRDRTIKKTVDIPFDHNTHDFYEPKLNKWLTK
jgi:hypothetical protein